MLTRTSFKLLEHVTYNLITDVLIKNNKITAFRHGFQQVYSTLTQLVITVLKIAATLDKSGQVELVLLDFSKAFDKVPHLRMIFKLEILGLDAVIVKKIAS